MDCTASSWRVSDSTSVRSRITSAVPRSWLWRATRRAETTTIRSPTVASFGVDRPDLNTSKTLGVKPISSTGWPGSLLTPSSRHASSLTNVVLQGGVGRQDPLADSVQDGGLLPDQFREFGGFKTERQSPPSARQGHRADHAEQQCRTDQNAGFAQVAEQLLMYCGRRDADTDLADDPIGIRLQHKNFRSHRFAEGAGFLHHHLSAGQRLGRIGADHLAEAFAVGVGKPDALLVGDHDEQRASPLLCLDGDALELPTVQFVGELRTGRQRAPGIAGDLGPHRGLGGDRAGNRKRALTVLGRQPLIADVGEHAKRQTQSQRHHHDLQQQHLSAQPHGATGPAGHGSSVGALLSTMRKTSESLLARVVRTSEEL